MKNMLIGLVVGATSMYCYNKYMDGSVKRMIHNIKPMIKNTFSMK